MVSTEQLARMCKVLSVRARVRIIELLTGGALCVNAISARLDITQGAVSQHLRVLRDAGLVTAEKRGYYVHYSLAEGALARFGKLLNGLLRAGASESGQCKAKATKQRSRSCVRNRKRPSARTRKS